jgi:hypothetical protein
MIKDEFDNFEVQIYKSHTDFYVNKVKFCLGSEFGVGCFSRIRIRPGQIFSDPQR